MNKSGAVILGALIVGAMLRPLLAAPDAFAAGCLVTRDEFGRAVQALEYPAPAAAQYEAMCRQVAIGAISSREVLAEFLAHAILKSDGLRTKREPLCVDTGCPDSYDGPGAGVAGQAYYGRGYLWLSWAANYRAASFALYGDDRLVRDPDLVARDEDVAWATAFWIWKTTVTQAQGYGAGFGYTTKALNGELECDAGPDRDTAKRRYAMYRTITKVLAIEPIGERGCYN